MRYNFVEEDVPSLIDTKQYHPQHINPGKDNKVQAIVRDYRNGIGVTAIMEHYGISAGTLMAHLWHFGLHGSRGDRSQSNSVVNNVKRLTPEQIDGIILKYQVGVKNKDIYEEYEIKKNTLYFLLDTNHIDRKRSKKDNTTVKRNIKRGKSLVE